MPGCLVALKGLLEQTLYCYIKWKHKLRYLLLPIQENFQVTCLSKAVIVNT